jgi:hypothetical protein
VFTGLEYQAAAHMMFAGMVREGVECIRNTRARYDGIKRNPWDEAECGHHYARAMAAWSAIPALTGFQYHGGQAAVIAVPRINEDNFRSFWASGTGWGSFTRTASGSGVQFTLKVLSGKLPCRSCEIKAGAGASMVTLNSASVAHRLERKGGRVTVRFTEPVLLDEKSELRLEVKA